MNIKQMAAVSTAKTIAAILAVAIGVNVALEFAPKITGAILLVVFAGYLIGEMYRMRLAALESENTLKKLKDLG